MNDKLEYKGYTGSINYCANDKILYGKIDVIKPCLDIISYEGDSICEIEKAFQEAVEDYLDISKEVMNNTFTIICNNCGKETIVGLSEKLGMSYSNTNIKIGISCEEDLDIYCHCGNSVEENVMITAIMENQEDKETKL